MVCPGFLLNYLEGNESGEGFLRSLMHEMGHVVGIMPEGVSDVFYMQNNYENLSKCFLKHHTDDLAGMGYRWKAQFKDPSCVAGAFRETFEAINNFKAVLLAQKDHLALLRWKAYAPEISACYWGSQAMLEYIRGKGDISYNEKMEILRNNYGRFCDMPDTEDHPGENFRIGVSLRFAPGVNKLMGCMPNKLQPECGLAGPKYE